MGTNYYLHRNACRECHRSTDILHIGKSSGGWCFSLRIHPNEGIRSLDDWKPLFADTKNAILTKCGQGVSAEYMLNIIQNRSCSRGDDAPFGYMSWDHFFSRNGAEEGPYGLLRHRIEGICVGHGEGTWDLMDGEFS